MEEKASKDTLPAHLILGASDCIKIKTETPLSIGAREGQARLDNDVSW